MGHVRAAVETEHQHGHDAEGGGEEGKHELVCEPGEVPAVACVGQQADVEAESAAFERPADAVQASGESAQHRHQ